MEKVILATNNSKKARVKEGGPVGRPLPGSRRQMMETWLRVVAGEDKKIGTGLRQILELECTGRAAKLDMENMVKERSKGDPKVVGLSNRVDGGAYLLR